MNSNDWKNATPEQKNIWRYVRTLIAYNTITPIYYMGAIAASEFLTYNVGKLYFALEMGFSYDSGGGPCYGWLYNQANVLSYTLQINTISYNTTISTMVFNGNTVETKNKYFGRVANQIFNQFYFNGYRLNV